MKHRPRVAVAAVTAAGLAASLVGANPASAAPTSLTVASMSLPSDLSYVVGVDAEDVDGVSPGGYEGLFQVTSPGGLAKFGSIPALPNPYTYSGAMQLSDARLEIYGSPKDQTRAYDSWAGDPSVVVIAPANGSTVNVGSVDVPRLGTAGVGKLHGQVHARGAMPDDRMKVDIFQTTGSHQTSGGYRIDAFSSGGSRGSDFTTAPLWDGQYIAFVTDTSNGNQAIGLLDVAGDTTLDFDLDTPCFGLDECQFTGSIAPVAAEFHPVGPNRILDSRKNIGIAGAISVGDGRNTDPNGAKRDASRLNHEFKVTGAGGVPTAGVSAVLLNVTATGASAGGIAKLFPKPARTAWYEDQSSFPAQNPTGSVIAWGPNEDVASLMVVPVGAGGKIRIDSFAGSSVHLLADVVGWFDQGQPGQAGSKLTAVNPARLLDTRNGAGGPAVPFAAGETRSLTVSGVGGVPSDATAVVGTITGINPTNPTYLTVWPGGTPQQETSVLNVPSNSVRPNLVSIGAGQENTWSIFNAFGNHGVLFDVSGYWHPTNGGRVTPLQATVPVLDTQAGIGGSKAAVAGAEVRSVQVAGVGGIPADVKAVWVSVSASHTTAWSYLTLWGDGSQPEASVLNWDAGGGRTSMALVPVGADGSIKVFNAFGSVHVVAQVAAYVR